jgi:hypothetical protein
MTASPVFERAFREHGLPRATSTDNRVGFDDMGLVGFGAGDKVVIATGGPNGTALQRIEVPPPPKAP